jgi:hypothetical protein
MEEQSLELARFRAQLAGQSGDEDEDDRSFGDAGELQRLRELLDAKSGEVRRLADERERAENTLFSGPGRTHLPHLHPRCTVGA